MKQNFPFFLCSGRILNKLYITVNIYNILIKIHIISDKNYKVLHVSFFLK